MVGILFLAENMEYINPIRAISSAVERILHTDEATGSRPVLSTNDVDKLVDINTESLATIRLMNVEKL